MSSCACLVLNAICEVPDEAEQIEMMAQEILPRFASGATR